MGTKAYDNALDLITFSRNSGGTSLRKISYGSELVTNGTFDTDVNGWANLNADSLTWENGSIRVTDTTDYGFAYQNITVSVGSLYEVSVQVTGSETVNGIVRIGTGSNTATYFGDVQSVGKGLVKRYVKATASVLSVALANAQNNLADWGEFDNISVREVLFDQPDGNLQLFYHPADIPRIDYSPDGTAKGLLIEEQRTNNVTNSEACGFVDESGGTVTDSTTSAPYGMSSTVKRIQSSVLNGGGRLPVTILTGGDNYLSVYVRSRTGADQNLKISASGTVGATQVAPASGDWVRLGKLNAFGAGFRDMRILSIGEAIDIDIALPQVEFGSFPTSYIPTSGSTVTRAADVASIPVSAFGYNQSAGTVVVNTSSLSSTPVSNPMIYQLNNGTVAERITVFGSGNQLRLVVTDGSVDQVSIFAGSYGEEKISISFKENKFNHCVTGTLGAEDSSGTMPTVTKLDIGNQLGGNLLNGHIKSIQYFPRRLTNAQLQKLTS